MTSELTNSILYSRFYAKEVVLLENIKSQKEKVKLTISIDRETKEAAERVCEDLGLPLNEAINVFLKQVIIQKSIPFPITLHRHFLINKHDF